VRLQTKIWLGVCAAIGAIAAVDGYLGYQNIESDVHTELTREARIVSAVLLTTWQIYHKQFVASQLPVTEATIGLFPAYAQSRIAADVSDWMLYGLRFKSVSDRPRNPANQADAAELAAMEWFREHPKATEHIAALSTSSGGVYHFTAPIWIEPSCLSCHGERESAPLWIQQNYSNAYGYHVGDLRGVTSIKLPMDELRTRAREAWLQRFGLRAIGYAGLLTLLGVLLRF
jgi:hypothetical protein